ncbi:MAG: hypothetical protein V4650_02885 [Pseudomonadota bacterium]
MATMTVRSTYALDQPTALSIRQLAAQWGTSQAEVIRRSVAAAKEKAAAEQPQIPYMTPAQVIEYYRSRQPERTQAEYEALIAEMRRERHLASEERADKLDRDRIWITKLLEDRLARGE